MQTTLNVKTKILDPSIPTPALQYAKDGDAGIDLTATSRSLDDYGNIVYGTNRGFEIPEGYVGLVFPRSSNSKFDLTLTNCVGVIDSGYRGEVLFKYKPTPSAEKAILMILETLEDYGIINEENLPGTDNFNYHEETISVIYEPGDRIGQLIILPYPKVQFEEVSELSETERGTGGYGSTGN